MARQCHHRVTKNKDYKCSITSKEELFCCICREQYCKSHIIKYNQLSFYLTGQTDRGACYSCLLKLLIKEEEKSSLLKLKKKVEDILDRFFSKKKEFNQEKLFELICNNEFRDVIKANIRIIAENTDVKTESLYNAVIYDYAPLVALSYNLRSEYNYSFYHLLNALEKTVREFREGFVDPFIYVKDIDMDSYQNKLSVLGESFSLFSAAITLEKGPIAFALARQLTGNTITEWIHWFGKTIWPHETKRWTIIRLPLYLIDKFYQNISQEKMKN